MPVRRQWGTAIGAIGGIATSAIASDAVPISSGGGQTQIGGMTIGSKTVGSGSTGGTSTAQSAAQTPSSQPETATPSTLTAATSGNLLPIVGISAGALVLSVLLIVLVKRKG
jgi:hypothetical protein